MAAKEAALFRNAFPDRQGSVRLESNFNLTSQNPKIKYCTSKSHKFAALPDFIFMHRRYNFSEAKYPANHH
jgi:hypothetical protein